jgi:hypothetical protein
MKTIESLINKHKGRRALILCAGSFIKEYESKIDTFIFEEKPFTIGINNMTDFWMPDYHLWTNTQRFRTFGKKIYPESELLLGSGIHLKTIRDIIGSMKYTLINFSDMKEGVKVGYRKGKILGYFRTAGCLSIMIAHLMGAKNVSIVGMDGYSYYKKDELLSGKESHHCYGEGFTDTASWETCVEKDRLINSALTGLKNYGIDFKILTPTKYEDFYDGSVLEKE